MTIQHCGTNQRKIDTMYHIISILVHALAFNIDSKNCKSGSLTILNSNCCPQLGRI